MVTLKRIASCTLLAMLLVAAPASAQETGEAQLLAEDSAAIVDIDGQNRLVISGLRGKISVRVGREGEMRFSVRDLHDREQERFIALELVGRSLHLRQASNETEEPILLQVAVSPELAGRFELADSQFTASGFAGGIDLIARNVESELFALLGSLDADLDGGTLRVAGADADVTLAARGSSVALGRIQGDVVLNLEQSEIELEQLESSLDASLDSTRLNGSVLRGDIRVDAAGKSVTLNDLARGANVTADDAAVAVIEAKGPVEVDSNAAVTFRDLKADLRVIGLGGSVRGSGSSSDLYLRLDAALIAVDSITGKTDISGDGLDVQMSNMTGDILSRTTSSNLAFELLEGGLDLQNDFGDVAIRRAAKPLKIVSQEGNVTLSELSTSVEVEANGAEVSVGWIAVAQDSDSKVENETGDVWLHFPRGASGRVDGQAPYGRIESDFDGVHVSDDGKSASGVLGRTNRPTVNVKAGGNIYVREGGP